MGVTMHSKFDWGDFIFLTCMLSGVIWTGGRTLIGLIRRWFKPKPVRKKREPLFDLGHAPDLTDEFPRELIEAADYLEDHRQTDHALNVLKAYRELKWTRDMLLTTRGLLEVAANRTGPPDVRMRALLTIVNYQYDMLNGKDEANGRRGSSAAGAYRS